YLPDLKRIYATAKRSNNLYICLNSRTQIIKDAKNLNSNFKRLIQSEFKEEEISVLDLSNYSKTDKAFIFRKSFERKIDEINDKKELAERYNSLIGCDWSVIIGHKNFYPRVIELIVNNFQESDKNFHKYVI
ncbi:restriction endonuclease, partial [Staphylococcus pseudintermedius]